MPLSLSLPLPLCVQLIYDFVVALHARPELCPPSKPARTASAYFLLLLLRVGRSCRVPAVRLLHDGFLFRV